MVPSEILATALSRFRTHPVQTGLTLVGLVVGTAAIIVIVTLGLTGRAFVMAQIEGVGSHLLWASYEGTVTSGVSRTLDDGITEDDVRAVSARPEIFSGVTPLVQLQGTVTVESRAKTLAVLGTTPNYVRTRRNVRILRGRYLDDDDVEQRSRVCVVHKPLYEQLFGAEDGTEKTIRTLGTTFRVVGVFEKPVDTLGQGEVIPESIFVPVTVAWLFTPARRVDMLFADVRRFEDIPMAVDLVRDLLTERHHRGSVFKVQSMTTVIKVANAISQGLLVVFIVAAGVSVVVGGVGIMNILLASVEQRTREIGLRKSLGARRGDVLSQFLLEALTLGVVGASIGVVVGVGLPLMLRTVVSGVEIRVSVLSALLAFVFSCAVTVLFGVFPAWRAANLSPTEALRHE